MSKVLRTAAATALAALAIPAAASAAPASVAGHVRASDAAVTQLRSAVRHGHTHAARKAARRARHEAAVAARLARSQKRHAHRATQRAVAARSLETVAGQYDQIFAVFQGLVDQVDGVLQSDLASGLLPSINGREDAIALLTQLISTLPDSFQGAVGDLVAQLTAALPQQVQDVAATLQGAATPADIDAILGQVLATSSGLIGVGIGNLATIFPFMPAGAADAVEGAMTAITGQIGSLSGLLDQVTGIIGTTLGQVGDVITAQLGQVSAMLESLIGSGGPLGGIANGGVTGSFDFGGLFSQIADMITGFIPSFLPTGAAR